MNRLPRVLIISHNSLSKTSNNGKTMASLFSRWPKENIAQLFICSNDVPEWELCNRYYHIRDIDVLRNFLHLDRRCGGIPARRLNAENLPETPPPVGDSSLMTWVKHNSYWFEIPRDIIWRLGYKATAEFEKWIEDFAPEAVFFVGGQYKHSHDLALSICGKYHIPLYLYFTDDYAITRLDNLPWTVGVFARRRSFYRKTIAKAKECFAIGDYMAKAYSEYFGREFTPVMNTIQAMEYTDEPTGSPLMVSFIGGLHLNRWKSLVEIGAVLDKVSERCGIPVELNIYCAQTLSRDILGKLNHGCMRFRGRLNGSAEVEPVLRGANILLHVESMDKRNRRMTKMSVSTKISEYLISGRCVIAYGPHEIASIRIIEDNHIGVALTDLDSDEEIAKKLSLVLADSALRRRLGLAGRNYAVSRFIADKVLDGFAAKFCGE